MFCKHCGKELQSSDKVCPFCGKRAGFPWKIVAACVAAAVLLAGLAWLVYFGVTGGFKPRENDVHYRDSYTLEGKLLSKHDTVVATMGEHTLTNGQLQVFYWTQVYDFLNNYSYYLNYMGLDYTKPLDQQTCFYDKELTWQQYFLEGALNAWKQYQALYNEANKAGYELPEAEQTYLAELEKTLKETAEKYEFAGPDELLAANNGEGCTLADYRFYLERYYLGNLYFGSLAEKLEATDDEIAKYFEENKDDLAKDGVTKDSGLLLDLRHILLTPEGGTKGDDGKTTVYSDEEWEACRKAAQALLDKWLEGDKTADSFAELAKENSKDKNTASQGGLIQFVGKNELATVDVRHILVMPKGGTKSEDGKTTVYSDEEWEACRKAAQDILDEYLAGEQTEERFGELANEKSEDKDGKVTDGGLYADVAKGKMVQPFEDWIFDGSREPGETGLVKTEYGYHVMYFVHRDGEMDDWSFAEDRAEGDYGIVKTDVGYQILYFVTGEEGWIRCSEGGVLNEKAADLLKELTNSYTIETNYKKIFLGLADLG